MSLSDPCAPASLDLPPGFRAVALRESGDAYAHACRIASEDGAGTLVWVRRFDVAEFAVVMEPETPLHNARKSVFMGMNALIQAIAANGPPERSVAVDWPDAIRFNAGLVGGGRLGWPDDCSEDDVPAWLVFGAVVRLALPASVEPGRAPDAAALEDEGFEGQGPMVIIESFARFLMLQVDIWRSSGIAPIIAEYAGHLAGSTLSVSDNGDLRLGSAVGAPQREVSLLSALSATSWLDHGTGAPRL